MRDLDLGNGVIVSKQALRSRTSRSGGPGGQNVNKLETRVTIELEIDDLPLPEDRKAAVRQRLGRRVNRDGILQITSQSERSQLANRDRALERMEQLLRQALIERTRRKPTRTPGKEKRKRLEQKKRRGEIKRLRSRIE